MERQPGAWGCHRTHQAGETYRRPGAWRRHRMDRAVGEHWSPGAQPWHHFSRLDDPFSPDPPECRHRLKWAVGEHWRSGAYHSHLSLRFNTHIRRLRAERWHRTHCTLPRRHSTQLRRRIPWTETAFWRLNTLGWHNTPWLDAHSRLALAGGWPIAHRAVSAYWRHRALDRITRCLTSTALLPVSTKSGLRSPT